MATSQDSTTSADRVDDDELIDLVPTMQFERDHSDDPRPGVANLAAGSMGSLTGEVQTLRRSRLGAAATFLAVAYGVIFLWILFGSGADGWLVWTLMGSRCVLAAGIAFVLMSRAALPTSQLRVLEYALFGGITLILMIAQYQVNLDLMRSGDALGTIAYMKNGVIQMFTLMILYGMFIPNPPRITAKVVLTMALAPVISFVLLVENEEVSSVVDQLRTSEQVGSNVLFLLIGAALAVYGSHVLTGLRVELHQAQKFGKYQLGKQIGVGGMGEVYLAEHQMLKRPCALKLIKAEAGTDPITLARFEREVQSAAQLSHPNTIEIFDYGHTDDGTFYYVMEYLQGMSLADLVRVHGPLPAARVIYLMRQVCAGLAEAHGLGLVHRDLKPANIFIAVRGGEFDVAKVLDFGLVKLTKDADSSSALTGEYTVSGTPLFMAPEQAAGAKNLDARADVYALGAILYYMLTGQPPFQAEAVIQVMIAHARDPVVPPSVLVPSIPKDLEQIVIHSLGKKPEDRYQDVKAMGKALASCSDALAWNDELAEQWWTEVAKTEIVL